MIPFQLSPVDTRNSVRKAMPKLEKVACRLRPSQGLSSLHSARETLAPSAVCAAAAVYARGPRDHTDPLWALPSVQTTSFQGEVGWGGDRSCGGCLWAWPGALASDLELPRRTPSPWVHRPSPLR